MTKISIVDQPVRSFRDKDNNLIRRDDCKDSDNPDKLGTGKYATSLADFIMRCDTPLTIGIQGEWGSGKTSLLNMIVEDIKESKIPTRGGGEIKGAQKYCTIWINTWEHSLLKDAEGCLVSIIEEIIEKIAAVDGSWQKAQKAKAALGTLARGALKVSAGLTMGLKGAEVAEELVGGAGGNNSVKQLRNTLDEIIRTVVDGKKETEKFVIFIDDLDRLEPSVAVQVLELLKNIFTVEHCVFVLAVDYQVVVKGLKDKFGEPSSENEWEFRAFFDKIIQLPFMMPMAKYDLRNFINKLLVEDIGYISRSEKKQIEDGGLARIVKYSLGHNPRAMKRLLNSLSLIKIQNSVKLEKDSETQLRKTIFAMVCLQISYPRVYQLLLRLPDFTQWNEEFVSKVTGGTHEEEKNTANALERALTIHEEDFDEEWEKALFKIVWLKNWQRKRLPETSRLLSEIKDGILGEVDSDELVATLLREALEMTAVTAVASTEDGIFADDTDENSAALRGRLAFWSKFINKMAGSKSIFDTDIIKIKSNYSSGGLTRASKRLPDLQFEITTKSAGFLKISTQSTEIKENVRLIKYIRNHRQNLESITKSTLTFKIVEDRQRQVITFRSPDNIPEVHLDRLEHAELRDEMFNWLRQNLGKVEEELSRLSEKFRTQSSNDGQQAINEPELED